MDFLSRIEVARVQQDACDKYRKPTWFMESFLVNIRNLSYTEHIV